MIQVSLSTIIGLGSTQYHDSGALGRKEVSSVIAWTRILGFLFHFLLIVSPLRLHKMRGVTARF